METFSALLAICAGNSPVTGEFPAQRPVTRSFYVFFDLRLNEPLSKHWWGYRAHNDVIVMMFPIPARSCPRNMVYTECAPRCTHTCKSMLSLSLDCNPNQQCLPGCTCQAGYVLHEDRCIPFRQCPCAYHNKVYNSGETIAVDCNQW